MERFWVKADRSGGDDSCWLWTAGCTGNGYGAFKDCGKSFAAHRLAYELAYCRVPDGMVVCHTCDTPKCVNPSHLFLGTHADNAADRNRKNRQSTGDRVSPERRPHGETHHSAKLTEVQVRTIRSMALAGTPCPEIALKFGVDRQTIWKITRNRIWRRVA